MFTHNVDTTLVTCPADKTLVVKKWVTYNDQGAGGVAIGVEAFLWSPSEWHRLAWVPSLPPQTAVDVVVGDLVVPPGWRLTLRATRAGATEVSASTIVSGARLEGVAD